jgi:hypothetical protein
MTEAEWLVCTDWWAMLRSLRGKASDRKLRLFAVACCRRVSHMDREEVWQKATDVAERYADGLVSKKRMRDTRKLIWEEMAARSGEHDVLHLQAAAWLLLDSTAHYYDIVNMAVSLLAVPFSQAGLLRDIIGNPFRPVPLDPVWLCWNGGTVRKLAQATYDEHAFDHLPILADALEEAGCMDAAILDHCRGPGPHVRGCWVIDLLLGKT